MNYSTPQSVAVIGLGAMGLPIAKNLLKAGHDVYGCDLDAERRGVLDRVGGKTVAVPAELPAVCTAYFVILPNPFITETALFGDDGVTAGPLANGDLILNLGTIGPDAILEINQRLVEHGARMLDVPMGKSSAAAESGTLSLLVSGEESVVSEARPLLASIASELVECGPLGVASTVKIVNNLVSAGIADLVAQALALGVANGAPTDLMIRSLSSTGADNWQLRNTFAQKVTRRDFAPGFTVDLATKDLRIGLDLAARSKLPIPTIAQAHQRFILAQASGWGNEDWGALAKVAERESGIEIRHDGGVDLSERGSTS